MCTGKKVWLKKGWRVKWCRDSSVEGCAVKFVNPREKRLAPQGGKLPQRGGFGSNDCAQPQCHGVWLPPPNPFSFQHNFPRVLCSREWGKTNTSCNTLTSKGNTQQLFSLYYSCTEAGRKEKKASTHELIGSSVTDDPGLIGPPAAAPSTLPSHLPRLGSILLNSSRLAPRLFLSLPHSSSTVSLQGFRHLGLLSRGTLCWHHPPAAYLPKIAKRECCWAGSCNRQRIPPSSVWERRLSVFKLNLCPSFCLER